MFKATKVGVEIYLQEKNPHPKVIIKEGQQIENPEYNKFELSASKNRTFLLINPIDGKESYEAHEVDLIWQAWDTSIWVWFDCRFPHEDYEERNIPTRQVFKVAYELRKEPVSEPVTEGVVSRRARNPITTNEYNDLLKELNNLMIAIKVNKSDSCTKQLKENHPFPTNSELDNLQARITEALRKFDKPMVRY